MSSDKLNGTLLCDDDIDLLFKISIYGFIALIKNKKIDNHYMSEKKLIIF